MMAHYSGNMDSVGKVRDRRQRAAAFDSTHYSSVKGKESEYSREVNV